jgi:hypothetical protein
VCGEKQRTTADNPLYKMIDNEHFRGALGTVMMLICALLYFPVLSAFCFKFPHKAHPTKNYSKLWLFSDDNIVDRTLLSLPKPSFFLNHSTKITFIGSCFSETLFSFLSEKKFPAYRMGGTLFNPYSISLHIHNTINKKNFTENELLLDKDIYVSWDHDRKYAELSAELLLERLNDDISTGYEYLIASKALFITLGTHFIHKRIINGKIVANCHKRMLLC